MVSKFNEICISLGKFDRACRAHDGGIVKEAVITIAKNVPDGEPISDQITPKDIANLKEAERLITQYEMQLVEQQNWKNKRSR
jgi:hypothetical protein